MKLEITEKQKRIYEIIKSYIEQNGYSPSIREIANEAGLSSSATIYEYIHKLKNKGYITYIEGKNRTIRILKEI